MEENLYNRIGEADLNPTYKDGQVYQHTDVNNMLSILKLAVNENYYDIQRLWNGERTVGNADQLDGATLSRYLNEELQADDNKVPSSQQVMSYINALFEDFSPPIRGVDYWTEEDKLYIIDETANRIIDELKGEYDADTTYEKLNIVFYQGSTYFALRQTKGNLPTNTTYWQLLAKRGDSAYELYQKHGGTLPEDVWLDEFTNAENFYNKAEVDNKLAVRDLLIGQKPYYFDNVAAMKSYDLKAGDFVITKGYYQTNDGGGASYEIVNDNTLVDDGGSVHTLSNGLKAKLIFNNEINALQIGLVADDETAYTNNTQKLTNIMTKIKTIIIPEKTFYVNGLNLINGVNLKGLNCNTSILKYNGNNNGSIITIGGTTRPYDIKISNIKLQQKSGIESVNGIEFLGNNPAYITIEKCRISSLTGDGIKGGHVHHVNNLKICECYIEACNNGINLQYDVGQINAIWINNNNIVANTNVGILFYGNNVIVENNTIQSNGIGISVGSSSWSAQHWQYANASSISSNYFEQNTKPIQLYGDYITGRTSQRMIKNLKITQNYFAETSIIVECIAASGSSPSSRACVVSIHDNYSTASQFLEITNNAVSYGSEIYNNSSNDSYTKYSYFIKQANYKDTVPNGIHNDGYIKSYYNDNGSESASNTKQITYLIYYDSDSATVNELKKAIRQTMMNITINGQYEYGSAGKYDAKVEKFGNNTNNSNISINVDSTNKNNIPFISPITVVENHPDLTGNTTTGLQFTLIQQNNLGFPYNVFIEVFNRYTYNLSLTIKKTTPTKKIGAGAPTATPNYIGEVYFDSTNKKWYMADSTSTWSDTGITQN